MTTEEKWTDLFKQVIGRAPTPQEFMAGKETDFDLREIKRIAGQAVGEAPAAKASQPSAELNEQNPASQVATEQAEIFDIAEESYDEPADLSYSSADQVPTLEQAQASQTADNPYQEQAGPAQSALLQEASQTAGSAISRGNAPDDKMQEWVAAFEKYIGRKPAPAEFQAGRMSNFDVASINQFIPQVPVPPKAPMPKWKKVAIGSGIVLALALAGAYAFANNYYSQESVAKRYEQAASKGFDQALSYQVWADNKKTIKKSDLTYADKKSLKVAVPATRALDGQAMVEAGREWLLFPKWRVAVKPASAQISSNASGLTISVNNKELEETKSDSYQKTLDHLYPGAYAFKATGKVDNQQIDLSANKDLTGKQKIDLGVVYKTFEVNSNLKDGDLYAGNNKVGTLSDGTYEANNLALSKTTNLYVQKTFADGTKMQSRSMTASDVSDDGTITLDADGILDRDTANDLLTEAYSKLSYYASNESTPDNLDDVFQNGNQNKFYNDVKKTIDHNLHEAKIRNADSISFSNVDVTKVTQTGKDTYTVDFNVVYSFYYSYSSEYRSSGYIKQKMSWSTHVKYVPKDDDDDDYYSSGYRDYRITEPNGASKTLSTDNDVS